MKRFFTGFIFAALLCSGGINYGLLSGRYGVTAYEPQTAQASPAVAAPVELADNSYVETMAQKRTAVQADKDAHKLHAHHKGGK